VHDAILRREGVGHRDELLQKYQGFVWKIAYRFLRDAEDALDVTQDVLLRLHTHLESLEPETRLGAWLTRVTTNAALNFARSRNTRRRHHEKAAAEAPRAVAAEESGGFAAAVASALETLPRGQRAVVTLRLLEERTFREMAEIFGVAEGTVKVQFARGLRRLREELAGWK
jgi:RNA polymerase sigma-70 factor (ECF subfamily)